VRRSFLGMCVLAWKLVNVVSGSLWVLCQFLADGTNRQYRNVVYQLNTYAT